MRSEILTGVVEWEHSSPATVSLRRLADRLIMGRYTRVTQTGSMVARKPAGRLAQLCRQLERELEHA